MLFWAACASMEWRRRAVPRLIYVDLVHVDRLPCLHRLRGWSCRRGRASWALCLHWRSPPRAPRLPLPNLPCLLSHHPPPPPPPPPPLSCPVDVTTSLPRDIAWFVALCIALPLGIIISICLCLRLRILFFPIRCCLDVAPCSRMTLFTARGGATLACRASSKSSCSPRYVSAGCS